LPAIPEIEIFFLHLVGGEADVMSFADCIRGTGTLV